LPAGHASSGGVPFGLNLHPKEHGNADTGEDGDREKGNDG